MWLLATKLTDDGKGIVCDDPISGTQIVLGYDASTKTVGGAIGVFDPRAKNVIAYNEANVGTVASDAGLKQTNFVALDVFAPASYFAVTIAVVGESTVIPGAAQREAVRCRTGTRYERRRLERSRISGAPFAGAHAAPHPGHAVPSNYSSIHEVDGAVVPEQRQRRVPR